MYSSSILYLYRYEFTMEHVALCLIESEKAFFRDFPQLALNRQALIFLYETGEPTLAVNVHLVSRKRLRFRDKLLPGEMPVQRETAFERAVNEDQVCNGDDVLFRQFILEYSEQGPHRIHPLIVAVYNDARLEPCLK